MFRRDMKSGVSLVTVLLFMLVATIAATATYKWLTSEGRSSANRMMANEAYQSSVAGIESAISWMTYHANDVGALIRQYKVNGSKAVNLDKQLVEFVRPGQNFHVWIAGVNAAGSSYKLKLISQGTARNGKASHSEVAILNVDGLYRVNIPSSNNAAHANFDAAYFGGSTDFKNTNSNVSAAIVNGNLSGSQLHNAEKLIVTGNVDNGGTNYISLAKKNCIGGNLNLEAAGSEGIKEAGDIYIHGNTNGLAFSTNTTSLGNVYFNGNVSYKANFAITINNVTLNGKLAPMIGANTNFHVKNNMCLTNAGNFDFKPTSQRKLDVDKGVWIPNEKAIKQFTSSTLGYAWLGKDETNDRVYIKNGHSCKGYREYKRFMGGLSLSPITDVYGYSCGDNDWYQVADKKAIAHACVEYGDNYACEKWPDDYASFALFKSKGSEKTFPTTQPSDLKCAEDIKTYCDDYLKPNPNGCSGSQFKVNDVLKANYSTTTGFGNSKYETQCVKDVVASPGTNGEMYAALKNCRDNTSSDKLFGGEYLVVKIPAATWNAASQSASGKKLQGKYIFYVTGSTLGPKLPPTDEESYAFVYLPEGAGSIRKEADNGKYNYFFFSAANITSVDADGAGVWNGSFYLTASNCATVESFSSGNSTKLEYNEALKFDLENKGIICPYESQTCGASGTGGTGGSSSSVVTTATGGPDAYYIAIAPQLYITLETQYANEESVNDIADDDQEAEGSFIVLPRIIYLPQSPKGELSHYYSVVTLNSKTPMEGSPTVSCDGAVPTSGKLVPTSNHSLTPGNYTCTVTGTVAGRESTVPFYVVVASGAAGNNTISFVEGVKELKKTDGAYDVKLKVPTSSQGTEYTVKVDFPVDYDNTKWTVVPNGNTGACPDAEGQCTFVLSSTNAQPTIFTVSNINATEGQLQFNIADVQGGAGIGSPYTELVIASTKINVIRQSVKDWCEIVENAENATCVSKKNNPECSATTDEWVQADGSNCSFVTPNNEWTCAGTSDISLKTVYGNVPQGCEVVIPGSNEISPPFDETVYLPASLMALPFKFTVGFASGKGANASISGNPTIHISVSRNGEVVDGVDCSYTDFGNDTERAKKCKIAVFYGDQVSLWFPPDPPSNTRPTNFNYWMCENGSDCPTIKVPESGKTYQISVTGDDYVVAHFDESDKHCFFDIFRDRDNGEHRGTYEVRDAVWCSASNSETEYCIDGDGTHTNAKWLLHSGSADNIVFNRDDGSISFKAKSTRTKSESQKPSATIMNRVKAGTYGTLKAQFQVPREGVASGDIATTTVKQSGFILRSLSDVSSYLMLNVYSDKDNKLMARICLNGGSTCKAQQIGNATAYPGDIILMAATFTKSSGNDALEIRTYTYGYGSGNAFSENTKSTTFELSDGNLNGVQTLANQNNEYVGFRLSDQNFKIYGIGWKSDDYVSECWDSYPTISCSFKAAYAGGIVPSDDDVTPWVGFSRWFDNYNNQCAPVYYYSGEDTDNCTGSGVGSSAYKECSGNYYHFSKDVTGPHGNGETNAARVGVNSYCGTVRGELVAWLNNGVAAHCGSFWVGEHAHCVNHALFSKTVSTDEGDYYGISSSSQTVVTANLREADLYVQMDNPNGSEVRIYLFSQNATSGYTYGNSSIYSLPYTTNASGTGVKVTVDVAAISQVDGFDPEKVVGVYVQHDGTVQNVSVYSRCPYALNLVSCRAEYNSATDLWSISATVTGNDKAGTIGVSSTVSVTKTVGEGDNPTTINTTESVTAQSKNCAEPDVCSWTGNVTTPWNDLRLTNTPYYVMNESNANSVAYQFTVTLTEENSTVAADGSPCITSPAVVVSKISRTCSIPKDSQGNNKSVNQGSGIPAMSYSVTGCPAASNDPERPNCGYVIKLTDADGTQIGDAIASGTNVNGTGGISTGLSTNPQKANYGTGNELEVGTYNLVLESTNNNYPFSSCSQTFEVKETGSQSDDYQATCWWEKDGAAKTTALAGSGSMNFKVTTTKGFTQNTKGKLVFNGKETEIDLYSNGNTSGISNYSTMPSPGEDYPYSVVYNGETICTGKITTVAPLTCEIPNEVEFNTSYNFVVTKNSLVNNCWDCNCSGTSECNYNGSNAFTVTSSNNPLTLSISCKCNDGFLAECSRTAQAEVVAPEISCSSTAIDVEPGTNITAPVTIGNCEGGCTYSVVSEKTDVRVTGAADPSTYNTTSVTFPGESLPERSTPYEYNITVSNTEGSDNCKIKVNYKKPSYSCPGAITAEPGTDISVTPTFSGTNYCATNGCSYTIKGTGISDIEGSSYTSGPITDKINDTSNPIGGTALTDGSGYSKSYALTLSNGAGSGTPCNVVVNYKKPTFTCPTNIPDQSVNAEVQVTPTGINYCTNGCTYKITGGKFTDNTDAGDFTVTSGGSAAIKKIKGESTATPTGNDGTEYTLTLHNPAGDDEESCSFKVKYNALPSLIVEFKIKDDGGFPNAQVVKSGSCLELTGKYTNQWYLPFIQVHCTNTTGIEIKYDSMKESGDYDVKLLTGVQMTVSNTKKTYISNVCVSGDGDVTCGFEGYNN